MPLHSPVHDDQHERNRKSQVLTIVVAFFFLILFLRLFYLQIIKAGENIRLSQENSMQLKVVKAPRGLIYDRKGRLLARNRPSYSLYVLPYKYKNRKDIVDKLLRIRVGDNVPLFDSLDLVTRLRAASLRRFEASRLKEDISMEVVSIIEEHSMELPGLQVEKESRREYPLRQAIFHALGYMSEIPENEYDSLKKLGYSFGDQSGKSGIERRYEQILRGKDGQEYIEVNAYGKSLGLIKQMPRNDPIPGDNLYLTIDAELQQVAYDAFPDSLKGAVVALDPRSGEVLVMLSAPAVDPNIFSMSADLRSKNWATVALDPNLPLNNRAIAGTYTPGSTFKLVTSFAGLSTGKLQEDGHMPVSCRGSYRIGRRVAHCWKLEGHGSLPLTNAVQQSCNVFFYQAGLRIGDETINKYAQMFGLGALTGVDLVGERVGWLSGEKEYNVRFASRGWKWTAGLLLDMAIGQTQVVTPIQLCNLMAGIGNTHTLYKPTLCREIRNQAGLVVTTGKTTVLKQLSLDTAVVASMHRAIAKVIEAGGTGGQSTVPGVPVGGKTGSAENSQGDKTHALFIACAPIENPVIAIAVVVENAGHGGSIAAPIAGKVLRHYFSNTDEGKQIVARLAVEKAKESPQKK